MPWDEITPWRFAAFDKGPRRDLASDDGGHYKLYEGGGVRECAMKARARAIHDATGSRRARR